MVNTGRPSGACGVCRERRIKCDETKPACLKCIRSGRTCSGYCHGLKLRDQTQKTIIKAKLGKPRGRRQNGSQDSVKKSTALSDTSSPTTSSPKDVMQRPRSHSLGLPPDVDFASDFRPEVSRGHVRRNSTSILTDYYEFWPFEAQMADGLASDSLHWQTIHTPLVEKARCYFLSSYVVYSPKAPSEGMFTFIPSILQSTEGSSPFFEDLFTAVSIAAFSMRPNASHAAGFSRFYYGRGVAQLREAIADETMAKTDAALASTILLGFYEGIVTEGSGIINYNPHFEGALALLRMRGDDQFATGQGTEMFGFVMQVLMRQYDLKLDLSDEDMYRWTVQAAMHPSDHPPHLTAMYVADLRLKLGRLVELGERNVKTIQTAMQILGTAQKFESMMTQRLEADSLESLENPEARAVPSLSSEHPALSTIVYTDWWTATRTLNKYAFRLLLCNIIADVSEWLDGPEGQFKGSSQKAIDIAKDDVENIVASIPYLCTWSSGKPRGASSPCGLNDVASVEGLTSLLAIWPLYLAADSRFATAEQKSYIQRRLCWIGENVGVKHASGVSKHLLTSS